MVYTVDDVKQMLRDARRRYLSEGAADERQRIIECRDRCFSGVKCNDEMAAAMGRFGAMIREDRDETNQTFAFTFDGDVAIPIEPPTSALHEQLKREGFMR